jgi:hypothetical protein
MTEMSTTKENVLAKERMAILRQSLKAITPGTHVWR